MASQTSGPENIGFLHQDHLCRIHSKRKSSMEEGDVFIILKYLENKQAHDRAFKYEMQVDENYNIKNIF